MVKPIPPRGPQNAFTRRWASLSDINFLSVFDPKPPKPLPRNIHINTPLPDASRTTVPKVKIWGMSKKEELTLPDGSKTVTTKPRGFGGHKEAPAEGWAFSSNQVLTSKYNIFTFLPRNLLEQVSHPR